MSAQSRICFTRSCPLAAVADINAITTFNPLQAHHEIQAVRCGKARTSDPTAASHGTSCGEPEEEYIIEPLAIKSFSRKLRLALTGAGEQPAKTIGSQTGQTGERLSRSRPAAV